jgi:hypothetical protein
LSRPSDEPRILAEDVRRIICTVIDPENPDNGEAVANFAERAGTSTRSIYRILSRKAGTATKPPSLRLDTADRMVTAAGRHLSECAVLTDEGHVLPYNDVP